KEDIVDLQKEKFIEILSYSVKNIPYYRDFININEINKDNVLKYLQEFPIVTKQMISNNKEQFVNTNYKGKVNFFSTSGTTGTPFSGYESEESTAVEYYIVQRMRKRYGFKNGAKITSFVGRKIISAQKKVKKFFRINFYD